MLPGPACVKDKISEKSHRSTLHLSPEALIRSISRVLGGWANCCRHGVSSAVFSKIDHHASGRIRRWLRRKYHHRRSRIGMPELRRRFCERRTWRFAVNGVRFTGASARPITRYRGSKTPAPFTPQPAAAS